MTRLFEPAAYGPQGPCFWADTVPPQSWPQLESGQSRDVAVIGGGFTGLNAALRLSQAGVSVTVLEAEHAGWGASGRNGGFCCLGGSKAPDALLRNRFGPDAPLQWAKAEMAAVDHVGTLIDRHRWDVDRHSQGETLLAHKPRAFERLKTEVEDIAKTYGVVPDIHTAQDLQDRGLGGPWQGGMTLPIGFALNPRKYHTGLAQAAQDAGATLYAHSPATGLQREGGRWHIETSRGRVTADTVILATNGYSHEDMPPWLRARTLPAQSCVIVTRPLTKAEQQAAGWWSAQMAYDTRFLLHYFRLLPDGRFLFGMRGGLRATPAAQARLSCRIRRNFARMFPAWAQVEITHEWSGLVCLMRNLVPFVGAIPDQTGLFAAMGYHGNGVAMGSYAGRLVADTILGTTVEGPDWLSTPPPRFPLGRYRRLLLAPAYLGAEALDL
ncbi:gamma-glutamylputrescine oxidoreductase [Antarctobacter heliothermus]|uniref:Gamma-glutamylputrescine oxidoreductase n=1 Tax=Antarctobacter heliothermus TaxID=74033 RepID=A0A222E1Y4_9RHOB|nr:FAD-binding oxidoreductase [Antarctobacter heliothermus]ASP19971.1 gamma-glutamylputrescine oxidoreductase [Antarctobacter heliothermus]